MINKIKRLINYRFLLIPALAIILGVLITIREQIHQVEFVSLTLHSSIEGAGAIVLIMAGAILFIGANQSQEDYSGPSIGFISMGILFLFHSAMMPGDSFVFTNSMAMLFGSIGFLTNFFFNDVKKSHTLKIWTLLTISTLSFLTGMCSIIFQDKIPNMVDQYGFTPLADGINIAIGIMFLISAINYMLKLSINNSNMIKILLSMTLLFGISSLAFKYSIIWHPTWWLWHLARTSAYLLLILLIFAKNDTDRKLIVLQNKEINETNIKLNNYSYTISHDLKEPIRSIRTFSEFIKEDYEDLFDDTAKDYFDRIINASTKMAAMIDDLLVLSRVGRTDVEFEEVSIDEMLKEVEESLYSTIREANAEIICKNMPVMFCQPLWIKMVFSNLISNSIKYKDETKDATVIVIFCVDNGKEYAFSVTDNGKGIPTEQHEKIFGLFRKAHSDRNIEGSGAGLAIVSAIIAQHGGKIWVDKSQPGVGTTIKFTIKRKEKNYGKFDING